VLLEGNWKSKWTAAVHCSMQQRGIFGLHENN
jgi:hypothetical protein